LSWAFYYLALHTDLQDKVADEIQKQLPDGTVSQEELKALPLVNAVWLETLRVKGPAPFDAFNNEEKIVIAGREVPPGSEIYLCYRYILHNADEVKMTLGTDLEKFRPERWLAPDKSLIKIAPFHNMPFGFEPRICLGMRMANYEGCLVIANVLKRFHLKPWQGPELTEKTSFVLEPSRDVSIALDLR